MPRISEQEDKLIMKSWCSQSGHTISDSYKSPILLLGWLNHVKKCNICKEYIHEIKK